MSDRLEPRAFPDSWWPGMTLRDYFAAAALPIAWDLKKGAPVYKEVAQVAYLIAEEMLKERGRWQK